MQIATLAPSRRLTPALMAGMIAALALACYWPALKGGVLWDDPAHLTRPALRTWTGLAAIWLEVGATQQYYPVLHTAFWIEHRLWGDAMLGYHLANVCFHAASAWLFGLILCRLLRGGPAQSAGWWAAVFFAVHPVGVESVAWISEQKNTLSLLFYLLAAWAYLDFDTGRTRRAYATASMFFLLALGTKTVTATLPAALLVIFWWQRGRLAWRRDLGPLVPWFVAALAAGLVTVWVERRLIGARGAAFDLSAVERTLLAGRAVWFYLLKLAWPAGLIFIYPKWQVAAADPGWWVAVGGVVGVTAALALACRHRGPLGRAAAAGLAGWLFFVGSLFPVLGFFNLYPFLFSYVADHFQYLASLGIFALAAGGAASLASAASRGLRAGIRPAGALLVAALVVLSNRQSRNYRDSDTLYRATLAANPDCWMARNNLAIDLAARPDGVREALWQYAESLRLNPNNAEAHNNYANLLATQPRRAAEALAHYREALRLRPDLADTHANLANFQAKQPGGMAEALAEYAEALRLAPRIAEVHFSLANALAQLPGRLPDALAEYERALVLNPRLAQAHVNLANELAKLPGRMPEALAHYEAALRIDPSQALAHYNYAVQLSNLPGREAEAQRQFEEALRLRPDDAKAHNDLGVLFARQGRFDEARRQWEAAVKLDPGYADPRRNLELLRRRQQP